MNVQDNTIEIDGETSSRSNFFKISNPYQVHDLESGRWFYYEDVVKNIKNIFEKKISQKIIVMQGNKGSGKTNTLRRMQEDKTILGERFKTIYIDSDKFLSNDIDLYLAYVYRQSIKGLRYDDFKLDLTDFWIEQRIALDKLKLLIDWIERSLEAEKILIFIFDEFDKFQRKVENPQVIRSIVDFFSYIVNNTNKIRLILSGERQIFELARKTNIEDIFSSAIHINIEEVFEEKEIRKTITDPVKGEITYDPTAIKYILDISGRNLYCQQLLCHEIFNYLEQQERNSCYMNDVMLSIEKLINEPREDFIFFWNNMDWRHQIIVAALADEKILVRRGQKYFMEESALLDAIFGVEKFEILNGLYDAQHLNKFEGVRFDDNPFKVPLFGEWVKRNHPLIDTIITNWDQVARHVSLTALSRIMELIPYDKIPLEKEVIETTIKLSKIWTQLLQKSKEKKSDRALIENLVQTFCNVLDFEIREKPTNRKTYFTINLKNLHLGELREVLLFIPAKEDLDAFDISYIQDEILRQDKPGRPSFLICLKISDKVDELIHKRFLNLVLIQERDLKNIALSSHPIQFFTQEIILKQVKPSAISTYRTEGPVTITFFGRADEISKIIKTTKKNFAIVGARKIGKTSLLKKVRQEIPSNLEPIYLDLEAPQNQNHSTFLALLSEEMRHIYEWIENVTDNFSNIRSIIRKLHQQTTKTPLFILDEIDSLLKYDREHDYQLFRTLRALFNEGLVQIIISGYEELYHEKHRIDSPLYNFCQSLPLAKLKENEALDLITMPMEKIGVKYNNPDDRKLMLNYTSRHPNLLQYFCFHLIEKIELHEDIDLQRVIFREDIEEIFKSSEYENYIVDDFYLFFKEDMVSIEKAIVLLLIDQYPNKGSFTTIEIKHIIQENGLTIPTSKLAKHLDNLALRYILEKETGGKYEFALPIFPEILRRSYDLKNFIQEALEDARKSL